VAERPDLGDIFLGLTGSAVAPAAERTAGS